MEIFQDMEFLVFKCIGINVEIKDMEIFQDVETFPDMEIIRDMEV